MLVVVVVVRWTLADVVLCLLVVHVLIDHLPLAHSAHAPYSLILSRHLTQPRDASGCLVLLTVLVVVVVALLLVLVVLAVALGDGLGVVVVRAEAAVVVAVVPLLLLLL